MSTGGRHLRSTWFAALVAALVAASPAATVAQTRLYVLFRGDAGFACRPTDCEPGHLQEIDVDRARVVRDVFIQHARERPSTLGVTPDGRYLVWTGSEADFANTNLSTFDTAVGQQSVGALLMARASINVRLFMHPSQVKAYLFAFGRAISVAEPGRIGDITPDCPYPELHALSGDGTRLFVRCVLPLSGETAVLDSGTGLRLATVSESHYVQRPNSAGTELYVAKWEMGQVPLYRRWDVATNTVLVERRVGGVGEFPDAMDIDPRTGQLWVHLSGGGVQVVDPVTLDPLARFDFEPQPRMAFDTRHARAFVATSVRLTTDPWSHYWSRIRVIDTDRLDVIADATIPGASIVAGIVLAPRPPQSSGLSFTVSGRDVTLSWSLDSGAPGSSSFVEAGSAAGLSNLASLSVAPDATSLVVNGVPAGTYFVRVRTRTAAGVEAVSNEVVVTVP